MIHNLEAVMTADLVVVEPHSDDAWLSLGEHLLDWCATKAVTILTVYGNQRRLTEAETFAHLVGAKHATSALPEGGIGLGQGWNTEIPSGILDEMFGTKATIIGPLGLRHPEHLAVVEALGNRRDLSYVELPYALTQKNAPEVTATASGHEIYSWKPRSAKINRASEIFKSQSMFWRNNGDRMTGAVEVVLR